MAWPYSFSGYPDPLNPYGSSPYPPPGVPGLDPFSPMYTPGAPGMGLPPMPGTSQYNAQATPTYLGSGAPPYTTPGSGYPPGLTSSPSYPATSSPSYPATSSPYTTSSPSYPATSSPSYPASYGSSSPYSTNNTSPYSTNNTSTYPTSTYPSSTYNSTSTYGGTSSYTTPGLTSSPSYPANSTAPYTTPSSTYSSGTSSYSSSSNYGSTSTYNPTTPSSSYTSTYPSSTSSPYSSFSDPYSLPSVTSSPYSLPTLTSTPSTYNLPTMPSTTSASTSSTGSYNSSYSLPSTTTPSYSLPSTTTPSYSLPSMTMPSYSLPSTTLGTGFSSYSLPSTTTPSYLTTPVSTYSTPSTSLPATTVGTTSNPAPTTTVSPVQAQLIAQHSQRLLAPSNPYPQPTTGATNTTPVTAANTAPSTGAYTQPSTGTTGAAPTTFQPAQPSGQVSEADKLRLEKLRLQQKENERLEEQLRKEREAQEKLRMEMEIKRQEEAKQKFLQLQQQKMEEERRKREAQRKIEEQEKLALEKRQRELELKAQEIEKNKTPVSSPTPPKPTAPTSTGASTEVKDTFFGSLIETSKTIANNCKRLSTLIMEQYDIVIHEGSAGRSLMMDLIAVVDGTLSRMIGMLNNNVMNIEDNLHDSIRLAASNLNGTVQALIGCVKNVSDVQKAGSLTAEERTKQLRQHNIAVSYAIKNLVEELQKLKVAERADPHAAKLLSANSLEDAENMSIAVTATQNAIDEVRIAQMPATPPPRHLPSPPVNSPKRRLDTQARLNIMNAPAPTQKKFTDEQIKKISVLQRRLKSWLVRRRMAHTLELMRGSDEMKQTHHRFRVLSEIMETEASYMGSLEICKKFFLDPLRAAVNSKPILSADDIKTIFSSMEMILGFTVQVKSHLEARMKQWPAVQKLGDIFKDLAPAMKIYADYVNKFDAAMEVYKERIQKPVVAEFLRDCMTRANTRLDLPSFLIMPVQRMPRYQLLLKELLKFTPESHVDHTNLKEAADAVTEVNVYINRKKQEQDNRLKIVALQEMIKSTVPLVLVAPHRLFVRQGPLFVKRNNETTPIACVVFMFSDLLIVTTQNKSSDKSLSFNYVDKLSFAKCDLADLGKTDFKITEEKKVITFTTASPEEQRGWVKELRETIETVKLHSQLDGDISDTNNFKEGFVLLSATYGQLHKPRHCIDVTSALQSIIKEQGGASLTLNADTKSKLPGFSDPSKSKLMPGSSTRKKNSLMIVFSANGQVRTRTFADADPVNLDANTP